MNSIHDAAYRLEMALDPDRRGGWTRLIDDEDGASEVDDLRTIIDAARKYADLLPKLREVEATLTRIEHALPEWVGPVPNEYDGEAEHVIYDINKAIEEKNAD